MPTSAPFFEGGFAPIEKLRYADSRGADSRVGARPMPPGSVRAVEHYTQTLRTQCVLSAIHNRNTCMHFNQTPSSQRSCRAEFCFDANSPTFQPAADNVCLVVAGIQGARQPRAKPVWSGAKRSKGMVHVSTVPVCLAFEA